ncbi:MAG: hypothetical protein R2688_05580 [Fimbriimonadaceae bacterium]
MLTLPRDHGLYSIGVDGGYTEADAFMKWRAFSPVGVSTGMLVKRIQDTSCTFRPGMIRGTSMSWE